MSHVGLSEHDETLVMVPYKTHTHTHTHTHTERVYLNSVSSQCARGKSSIARKPEFHPNNLMVFCFSSQKCNHSDFKFDLDKLNCVCFHCIKQYNKAKII